MTRSLSGGVVRGKKAWGGVFQKQEAINKIAHGKGGESRSRGSRKSSCVIPDEKKEFWGRGHPSELRTKMRSPPSCFLEMEAMFKSCGKGELSKATKGKKDLGGGNTLKSKEVVEVLNDIVASGTEGRELLKGTITRQRLLHSRVEEEGIRKKPEDAIESGSWAGLI